MFAQSGTRQNRTAIIEHPDHVAVANPACGGIGGVYAHPLPAATFTVLADAAHIHWAVQTCTRLRSQKVQRVYSRLARAEPLGRLKPGRMSRAVVVSKAGD